MEATQINIIPVEQTIDEARLQDAIVKLKKYDNDIVLHLEQLANLAEKNKYLFNIGLTFLKNR